MTDSLFAAIRAVAILLSADRKISPKQRDWFIALTHMFELTHEQRERLHGDLSGHGDLEKVHAEITNPRDRERLENWARAVMGADGKEHPRERAIYTRIRELNLGTFAGDQASYRALAEFVLESHNESQFWKELGDAGRIFSQPVRYGYRGYRHQLGTVIAMGLGSRNRFVVGTTIVFLGLFVLVTGLARGCSPRDFLTDAATRIAYDLKNGAERLGASDGSQLTVESRMKARPEGCGGDYHVELVNAGVTRHSVIGVWCKLGSVTTRSYSTSYHNNFTDLDGLFRLDKKAGEVLYLELERRGGRATVVNVH